uniref:GIY-YIG domain-containing protein n=1 Tax=viral metagenome TaxID=1070528 RepID=A0A6C0E4D6_9ZZZZ
MGIIYMITSPSGKRYVGQTIQPLDKRWKQHVDSAQRAYKDHCKVLNKSIRKYGQKHFIVEVLQECENDDIDSLEEKYIQQYNTLVPNGMNIKGGGKSGKHSEISKQKISDALQNRQVSQETREKLSSTTNPGLPMYLIKVQNGYRVCNHPMGPEKRFISKTKPVEYNYTRAIEYLNKLNRLDTPLILHKEQKELYIQRHKNGYCVKYPGTKPKYFVSKTSSTTKLYEAALNYLNDIKSMSAVQRLNVSG